MLIILTIAFLNYTSPKIEAIKPRNYTEEICFELKQKSKNFDYI